MENFESPDSNIKYVGFRKRFLAYLVDILILSVIGFGIDSLLGQGLLSILRANTLTDLQSMMSNRSILPALISFIVSFGFYILMWVNNGGATPGKELLGIKVVKADGSKIGYPEAIMRSVFGYTLSSVVLSLGFLWVIWDKKKQGWHDKIANTVVVESGKKPRTGLALILAIIGICLTIGIYYLFYTKVRLLVYKELKNKPVQTSLPKSRF